MSKVSPEQRAELREECELIIGRQMGQGSSRSSKILDLLDDLEAAEKQLKSHQEWVARIEPKIDKLIELQKQTLVWVPP